VVFNAALVVTALSLFAALSFFAARWAAGAALAGAARWTAGLASGALAGAAAMVPQLTFLSLPIVALPEPQMSPLLTVMLLVTLESIVIEQ